MRIFAVIATKNPPDIGRKIRDELTNFQIKDDVWLVAASGTTREFAEQLGIRGGETDSGLVCSIESYSGRLPKDAWEWLAVHKVEID